MNEFTDPLGVNSECWIINFVNNAIQLKPAFFHFLCTIFNCAIFYIEEIKEKVDS